MGKLMSAHRNQEFVEVFKHFRYAKQISLLQKLYKTASESIHEFINLTEEKSVKINTHKFKSLSIYL